MQYRVAAGKEAAATFFFTGGDHPRFKVWGGWACQD